MLGSLSLRKGVLYVGGAEASAHVRAYDLDGRRVDEGFRFRAADGGRAEVSGLSVDEDHRIWVADRASRSLRAFTLFGREVARVDTEQTGDRDRRGVLGTPVDVCSIGSDEEQRLLVASAGLRRHGVHLLWPVTGRSLSLRPGGEPNGRFHGVRRVAHAGRRSLVCETGAGRVQVFRDGEFHHAFRLDPPGRDFRPMAALPLEDGRIVLAAGGEASALLLLDSAGRLLDVLAEAGTDEGRVFEPNDLAVDPGDHDAATRVFVIDADGVRVQVFTLEGACYGAFPGLLD